MEKKNSFQPEIYAELYAAPPQTTRSGILILSHQGELLYLNPTAKDLLDAMEGKHASSGKNALSNLKNRKGNAPSPHLITRLHLYFQNLFARDAGLFDSGAQTAYPILLKNDLVCFARAFRLQSASKRPGETHLLILIEASTPDEEPALQSPPLTEREQVVVRLLFDGKTNKEVAVSMGISEHTVKEHMKRIMKKLRVANRAGIVAHFAHYRPDHPPRAGAVQNGAAL